MNTMIKYITCLMVVLLVSACAGRKTPPPLAGEAQPPLSIARSFPGSHAEQDFLEARDAYKKGDFHASLFIAHRITDLYPDTPWHRRTLFLIEQALIQLDRDSEAEAAMLRVRAEYPELADYAVSLLADYHYSNARYSQSAVLYGQIVKRYPKSLLVARAVFRQAQSLLESYAYPEAILSFENFLRDNPRSEFAPAAGLGLGRALTAEAKLSQAVRTYQDVWVRYPGDPNDREVEQALSLLRAGGVEVPELSSADLYERGRNLFRAKLHDKAVVTFTKYLTGEPDLPNRTDALYRTGVSLYYRGKRREAAATLEKMIQEYPSDERVSEALYWLGKSYSKLGDWDRGVKTFQRLLNEYPGSMWCDDALFLIGNIFRESGDMERALQFYDRLVKEYSGSKYADSAIWWKAWWRYSSGEYVNAERTLHDLANRYPKSFLVSQAHYWQGRAAEKQEHSAQALSYYQQVLDKGAYTYYGHRAAGRMAVLGSTANVCADDVADDSTAFVAPPCSEDETDGVECETTLFPWTEEMKQLLSEESVLQKVLELVHLDMKKEAAAELWSLKDRTPRRRVALMELSKVFFELGDYYRSLIIVLRGYDRQLDHPATNLSGDLWRLAYPQAFWESIVLHADKNKQDPYFIAAIIKEESQFRPYALSSAGARGLMQVMPATGEWVARKKKISGFDREKLYDADTAINIGTSYISYLMERFENDPLLVAAAYNAGPEAVEGWITPKGNYEDRDLFVEMIPYAETRRYVKKVLRNYEEYKRIYEKTQEKQVSN